MADVQIDLLQVFRKLATEFSVDSYTVNYCVSRIKSEGIAFLTVTLPKLGKAVLLSLEKGFFDRSTLTCFAWKRRSLRIFRSLLKGIFCEKTGEVLQSPDPFSIWGIRQISEYFYKLSLDFSESQLERAEENYLEVEKDLARDYDHDFVDRIRRNVEGYYHFPSSFDSILHDSRPRLGPGTFSGCENSELPWYLYKVSDAFVHSVPSRYKAFSGFFKPYPACPQETEIVKADSSTVAEVLFVPKDSRGPRVISREPLRRLSLQMAFFDWFAPFLERSTSGRINFQDQSINRELARVGSINGSYATFDLREASDRVKATVARHIFRNVPSVSWFLRTRTQEAVLPSGKKVRLRKLAGMGSGLTFVTMACIIHAAIATEIALREGYSFTYACSLVYVLGDDVIVPTYLAKHVKNALEKVGLVLNESKSFYRLHLGRVGYFRESCGGDYFNGNSVAPTRLSLRNSKLSVRRMSANGGTLILHACRSRGLLLIERHARELYINGLSSVAGYYLDICEKHLGPLPRVGVGCAALGRLDFSRPYSCSTDAYGNHRSIRAWVPVSPTRKYEESAYGRLARSLAERAELNPLSYLDVVPPGVPFGEVTVPRETRLRSCRLNELALFPSTPN